MKLTTNRDRALAAGGVLAVTLGILGAVVWNSDSSPSLTIPDLTSLGAEGLDRPFAEAALEAGMPVLLGLPDGGNAACHSLLLLPEPTAVGGIGMYIYNESGPTTEGKALDREDMNLYGCDTSTGTDIPRKIDPDAAPLPHQLDVAAKEAAATEGLPFLAAEQYGNRVYVIIDGTTWWVDGGGMAGPEGEALSRDRA